MNWFVVLVVAFGPNLMAPLGDWLLMLQILVDWTKKAKIFSELPVRRAFLLLLFWFLESFFQNLFNVRNSKIDIRCCIATSALLASGKDVLIQHQKNLSLGLKQKACRL